jgi:hypothetical protein
MLLHIADGICKKTFQHLKEFVLEMHLYNKDILKKYLMHKKEKALQNKKK